ncbi:MAG TPA: GIY-YIG nuclease family protein [Niabella sp.]|nr:GIY-YIG nuclease family protein [Niabella sp.]
MPACYILYSKRLNKYYVGATSIDATERINRHFSGYYEGKFTSNTDDWELFLEIDCLHVKQAFKIEAHIKRMKSRKYIESLKQYPQLVQKLLVQYS